MRISRKTSGLMSGMAFGATCFLAGVLFVAGLATVVGPSSDDAECPPMIEASTKLRLYFDESPPEPVEADIEFAKLCGVGGWGAPVREAPPEDGEA